MNLGLGLKDDGVGGKAADVPSERSVLGGFESRRDRMYDLSDLESGVRNAFYNSECLG